MTTKTQNTQVKKPTDTLTKADFESGLEQAKTEIIAKTAELAIDNGDIEKALDTQKSEIVGEIEKIVKDLDKPEQTEQISKKDLEALKLVIMGYIDSAKLDLQREHTNIKGECSDIRAFVVVCIALTIIGFLFQFFM